MTATQAARERGRRSQAERTAETRTRILAAVVESVAEVGFQRTTASEIARRAGVTWGAVQHHFGGKDGILIAVLEDSFERFAEELDTVAEGSPLETRVARFVERAWEHFGSPHYRSAFEILLHYARAEGADEPPWRAETARAWDRIWRRIFGDAPLSRRRSLALQRFTIATLSGLAATRVLEGPSSRSCAAELGLLQETLIRQLKGAR